MQNGLFQIRNLVIGKRFLTWEEFSRKYHTKNFTECYGIMQAIPLQWKKVVCDNKDDKDITNVKLNDLIFGDTKITTKVYWELLGKSNTKQDSGKKIWGYELNCCLDDCWEKRQQIPFKITLLT